MALPTILVDSATGSDTAASGAGPATALTGAAGVTDGAGTVITVEALTDISGVATDGSAVFYFADATAGNRNFGKITATAGSGGATPTVTVANAFGASLTKAWAIGGKRASIGGTVSKKLFDNNSAAGDAMPGWTIQMASAHSETCTRFLCRRAGDTTSGPITLQGASGAATLPLLTFTDNNNGFQPVVASATYMIFQDFEMRNSSGTKTAAFAFSDINDAGFVQVRRVKMSHSTNFWGQGFELRGTGGGWSVVSCDIGFTSLDAITLAAAQGVSFLSNYIHDTASGKHGVSVTETLASSWIGNIIARCGGDGFHLAQASVATNRAFVFMGNTVDSCTGDGFEYTAATFHPILLANNIFSNNGGYGVNFSNGAATAAYLLAAGIQALNNDFFTNTSGKYNPSGLVSTNESTLDPTFTNAAGGDFSIGANLKALGFPLGGSLHVGSTSATYSYVDIGAAERQETSGGTSVFVLLD